MSRPAAQTLGEGRLTPTEEWSRRVRRVGGLIQVAFAALWLVRGSLVVGGGISAALIALSGVAVIGVLSYAVSVTAGTAPRPKSREGKRLERDITIATVIELVAAFALPVSSPMPVTPTGSSHRSRSPSARCSCTSIIESTSRATGRLDGS